MAIGGYFWRTFSQGTQTVTAVGTDNYDSDLAIGFADAIGENVHLASFGAAGSDGVQDLAVDSKGAAIAVGTYSKSFQLGSTMLPVSSKPNGLYMLLAKFSLR